MVKSLVKIGELNFQLTTYDEPDREPSLEIENDASMVFESLDPGKARELIHLLEQYIDESNNYHDNMRDALL